MFPYSPHPSLEQNTLKSINTSFSQTLQRNQGEAVEPVPITKHNSQLQITDK